MRFIPSLSSSSDDAYELDHAQFLSFSLRPVLRPLPAINQLLSLYPVRDETERKRQIPLLLEFEAMVKELLGVENKCEVSNVSENANEDGHRDSDCSLLKYSTVLSHNNHKRIKELTKENNKNKHKAEIWNLKQLIKEEIHLYALAIDSFRRDNTNRFKIGFHSEFIILIVVVYIFEI